ncbi:P-loop containing nucleoside triphosphate hydrolase protein [Protomyces lactucae-debilis]|uniref:p-loop containing nucleoside triphosphate hydrolase protein n=1 Tax=Protomyces lactucae-debilis TaxID=2754530 RepID=A0A1Y2EYY0_PROLT|nr:P-loop containing nucleoside triphosphate hydrolase protein [Protomyces lactucae-debilis]ORY76316.1 P-loop containing nucleoside triphosphate hydrolase protein [Protomyces lactucae-debilis]
MRPSDERLYVHTTILSVCAFSASLITTLLPLLYIPREHVALDSYLSAGIQFLLILLPLSTPRIWRPVDPANEEDVAAPEQTCTPFSYFASYQWVDPVVRKGGRRDLELEDLPPLPDYDRAAYMKEKILHARRSTVLRTLLVLFRWHLAKMMLLASLQSFVLFIPPIAMRNVLQYLEEPEKATVSPYAWSLALLIAPILDSVLFQAYILLSTRAIVRVKSAMTQLIFTKVMVMRPGKSSFNAKGEESEHSTGKVSNLLSSDIEQITSARDFFLCIVALPISSILSVVLLYNLLGWPAFAGFAWLVVTLPIPGLLAKRLAVLQKEASEATDARLTLVNESLANIRITKMFGSERAQIQRITELRDAEQRKLWQRNFYSILISIVTDLLPNANMLITFLLYTKVLKKPLTASIAFTAIGFFAITSSSFIWIGFMSRLVIQAVVSMRRIDTFLNEAPERPPASAASQVSTTPKFLNATVSWGKDTFELKNLNLTFPPGLNLIVGPTGSGKSSLLAALLGEMDITTGDVHLPRQGGVSYVSQTAWLQNATIRNNILFGSSFDPKRYRQTLEACALLSDLALLDHGDDTEVGEAGVTLSGGQKQRLALARALYASTQIVLLDDVLSALDGGTGKHCFEKAICGPLAKDRTLILVTHNVALCTEKATQIVQLQDGQARLKTVQSMTNLASLPQQEAPEAEPQLKPHTDMGKTVRLAPVKLVQDEERASGRISRLESFRLVKLFGSPIFIAAMVVATFAYQGTDVAKNYWLGRWSDAYSERVRALVFKSDGSVHVDYYLTVYAIVVTSIAIANAITNCFFYHGIWVAAGKLHSNLLHAVFYAPLSWYDRTPVGRIVNRFAKDVRSLDSAIVSWLRMVSNYALNVLFKIFSIGAVMPLFYIPAMIVSVGGLLIGEAYTKASISCKRLVSTTESPLLSHFGDAISGIVTIRAFGYEKRFTKEVEKRIDVHTRPLETLYSLNRWVQVRADFLGSFITFSASILALRQGNIAPGLVGFSLSMANDFSTSVLYLVRTLNELEIELNSFQRVKDYTQLEQEEPYTEEKEPNAAWPKTGAIELNKVRVSYSLDGPLVLKDVSVSIRGGEKVGIVGRTGSGKSTFGLTLLRFTHLVGGSIVLDGVDISDVNLETLRKRVTIIPQDPILFSGTVRSNLDPFGEMQDETLTEALQHCGINPSESGTTTPVQTEGVRRITLDTVVKSNGDNFSQGQRQILALARAIVRRSKVIILDEATASVDFETDQRIQAALQTQFSGASILTIAHRLNTIADYDKILVLDKGRVVQFDSPRVLVKEEGLFQDMVMKSKDKDILLALMQ